MGKYPNIPIVPKVYITGVSDEPIEIIRSNQCEASEGLVTSRFRGLWNEIMGLREVIRAEMEYHQEQDRVWSQGTYGKGETAIRHRLRALELKQALGELVDVV